MPALQLCCPACHGFEAPWPEDCSSAWGCAKCGFVAEKSHGALDMLPPERAAYYETFEREYLAIRKAEGRGSDDPAHYLSLPFGAETGELGWQWRMRAKTYQFFEKNILLKLEEVSHNPLHILDLGAGNGWLSYRLAQRGNHPVAVDLLVDPLDGLGALRHYRRALGRALPALRAEFDNLPFAGGQFDLAIFNASFHYALDYWQTLQEARRCLAWGGQVVILDTPIYKHWSHGEQMREERHEQFERQFGFRSDSLPSVEYLDEGMLSRLAKDLNLHWRIYRPWYGLNWSLRPCKAALQRRRPPSRFWVLVGSWTAR